MQRQVVQHAAGAEDTAIARRQGCRQHDEVDDAGGRLDAQAFERHHEGAAGGADFIPWVDRQDDEQRADIENQDAPEHRIDGVGNRFLRVRRFAGRQADHFHAQVGKHHHLQRHQHALRAIREETAMRPQVRDADGHAAVAQTEDDHARAADDHQDDGDDLDQGEPELELAVGFHGQQVDRAHGAQGRQGPDPARHVGEPDAHVDGDGGNFRHARDEPQEPVVPARQIALQGAQVILGIAAERTGHGIVHGHFAQRAHDHEDDRATDDVRQHDAGTGHLDRVAGTQKQAHANRGAQRHQADLPLAQAAVQALFIRFHYVSPFFS